MFLSVFRFESKQIHTSGQSTSDAKEKYVYVDGQLKIHICLPAVSSVSVL